MMAMDAMIAADNPIVIMMLTMVIMMKDNSTDSGEKEELCGEREERVLWRGDPGRGEPV